MKTIYEVRSENLTGLGGPMGTERTWDNWRKFFDDIDLAKKFSEKDYKNKIKWKKYRGGLASEDLGHVMYYIQPIEIISELVV